MKICVFGAGAIGGVIAGKLARSGANVSIVARGSTLDAIRTNGLKVESGGDNFVTRPRVSDNPSDLGPQDIVLLAVKEHQLEEAMRRIGPLLGGDSAVVPPTTGIPYWFLYGLTGGAGNQRLPMVDPGGRLWHMVPPERVIGCVYWIGAHVRAPGVVIEDGKGGCPMGEPDGHTSPRLRALSDTFTRAGINAPIRENIRGEIWVKAINSLCWNCIACLTLAANGEIGQQPEVLNIVATMMAEADAMALQLGIAIPYSIEKRLRLTLNAPGHKMSMLRDLEAGRPLEFDLLERSIRSVSKLAGISSPTIDLVLSLMGLRVRDGEKLPSSPASQRPELHDA